MEVLFSLFCAGQNYWMKEPGSAHPQKIRGPKWDSRAQSRPWEVEPASVRRMTVEEDRTTNCQLRTVYVRRLPRRLYRPILDHAVIGRALPYTTLD